jgi:fermentation-respiration switch protein FrsA (DUF1100 family)
MLTSALWGFVIVLLASVIGLMAIWTGQRRLIYFPSPEVAAPAAVGLADVEAVSFPTADGIMLHGWFLRSSEPRPWFTVVVFNGNGGNRGYRAPLAAALRMLGCSVLLFDYRGFGENLGRPSEPGLAEDARAARAYLLGRDDTDPARLVYFGESLGTAVATTLAAEHPPAAMILRSPFVSLVALGEIHYPGLPVRWLLRDRFESIDHIRHVRSPLLVLAGSRDRIVPVEQSKRLYEAASLPKHLAIIDGADHNDHDLLAGEQIIWTIRQFLSRSDHA